MMNFIKLTMKYLLKPCFYLTWLLACCPIQLSFAGVTQEFQLKAAFLYNFSNFISWPSTAFDSPEADLQICIFGKNPFENILEEATDNLSVKSHPLKVKYPKNLQDVAKTCHILFISHSEADESSEIVKTVEDLPILTVSDIEDFMAEGGMINFYIENNKIRIKINNNRLEQAGLKADATLLNLAILCDYEHCSQK